MEAAPVGHANNVFSKAQEPLRQYSLLHLTAEALAHMRGVSKTAHQLVDEHTGSIWKAAATRLLDPACLHDSHHASAVQCTLREQAALLKNLRVGMTLSCLSFHVGWGGGWGSCGMPGEMQERHQFEGGRGGGFSAGNHLGAGMQSNRDNRKLLAI